MHEEQTVRPAHGIGATAVPAADDGDRQPAAAFDVQAMGSPWTADNGLRPTAAGTAPLVSHWSEAGENATGRDQSTHHSSSHRASSGRFPPMGASTSAASQWSGAVQRKEDPGWDFDAPFVAFDRPVQRAELPTAHGAASIGEQALERAETSSGQALPKTLQRKFEGSLGTDLSGVRIHTGETSARAAEAVGARAFAVGKDIHFGKGQHDPTSSEGQHLLAHEVAHTVQQSGSAAAPAAQFKLDVSAPGDPREVEADNAANAMVRSERASVGMTGPLSRQVIQRDPNLPTNEPELPRPLYWANQPVDADIVGAWSGEPIFTSTASGDLSSGGVEWVNKVGRMKDAFTAVWNQAKSNWNGAVPAFRIYKEAAQDAENKGLADFGGKGLDIDLDADQTNFGGKTSVSEANMQDQEKIQAGDKTFNATTVDPALKRQIIDEKVAVAIARREADKSERSIDTATGNLDSKRRALDTAVGALSAKKDSQNIAQLNIQIQAMRDSAGLVGTALSAMTKIRGGDAASVAEAGGTVIQMINTLAWEAAIRKINSQVQVLQGSINYTDIQGADDVAKIAENEVKIAARGVSDALDEYKSKCAAVKKAHAAVAASLEKATVQSGGSKKQGERVRTAVEAIPLMELTLKRCQDLNSHCRTVPENDDARAGGGMTSNGNELVTHNGILESWKQQTSAAIANWQKRLTLARQLMAQAH